MSSRGKGKATAGHVPLFSPVMATGIVAAAAGAAGEGGISAVLLRLATVLYAVLLAYHLWRFARHRPAVVGELRSAAIFNYLSFVAAGALLGSGLLHEGAGRAPAWVLLAVSGVAGAAIFTTIAAELVLTGSLHPRREAQGGWLLAVVAPQALGLLVADLAQDSSGGAGVAAAVALWILGALLYPPIAIERLMRLRRGRSAARALRADDWILSGAAAVSALAGSHLVALFADPPCHDPLGAAMLAASGGQLALAWILVPLLCWGELRHLLTPPAQRAASGSRWATVFPLGTLSLASHEFAAVAGIALLGTAADIALVAALVAWTLEGALAIGDRGADA